MIGKHLKAGVQYAMEQATTSHIAVLEDTTGKGTDSAEYEEMQTAAFKEMIAKIDAAEKRAAEEEEAIAKRIIELMKMIDNCHN